LHIGKNKKLVTEMDYNNISIKVLEEEFPQEDSKVKLKLEDLLILKLQ
jgi:hypothetical protein